MDENYLNKIFVDKNELVDEKLLVDILEKFVTIDEEGIINFSESYEKLVGHQKVLIYLCCKKAMALKQITGIKEPASQSEVSKKAHVTLDTSRNALHKKWKKLLSKVKEGYIIPNYNLKKINGIIENGEKKK